MNIIDEIIVVTGKEDLERVEDLIGCYNFDTKIQVVVGGRRRQDSVYNALKCASGNVVMVHDGARPFVSKTVIEEHLTRIESCDGLITCVPSKDTIKVVVDGVVKKTLNRNELVNVQTPQTFHTETLLKAYEQHLEVTDDASLMEQLGYQIQTVMGDYNNIKITTPEDLGVGMLILKGEI
jgi:2-C-methyl-D-erythritol 4-phosphate cytidylyltransferase